MNVVADESLDFADEAFAQFGSVRLMPGRAIDRTAVRSADLLFVRSHTRVDASLLDGTRVRFVGSGVIGLDHVDLAYVTWALASWTSGRASRTSFPRMSKRWTSGPRTSPATPWMGR